MVAEEKTTEQRGKRRAASAHSKLVRRSLLIDPEDLERLGELLHMTDPSEIVREAIERVLLVEEVHALGDLLRSRGTKVEDLYTPSPPLPGDEDEEVVNEVEEDVDRT